MDFSENITVIGSDARQFYLYKYFKHKGCKVFCYGVDGCNDSFNDLDEALQSSGIVIAPVPVSRYLDMSFVRKRLKKGQIFIGGNIPKDFVDFCTDSNIRVYDFMCSENLAMENAILTGEGVISEIIRNTPFSIRDSKALVIGFGRCGGVVSRLLKSMGCSVSILEDNSKAITLLKACEYHDYFTSLSDEGFEDRVKSCDFIVNTVPAVVLDDDSLAKCRKDCILFDIASKDGVDVLSAKRRGMKYIKLPGLPGRFSPKTAGELIAKDILSFMISPAKQA